MTPPPELETNSDTNAPTSSSVDDKHDVDDGTERQGTIAPKIQNAEHQEESHEIGEAITQEALSNGPSSDGPIMHNKEDVHVEMSTSKTPQEVLDGEGENSLLKMEQTVQGGDPALDKSPPPPPPPPKDDKFLSRSPDHQPPTSLEPLIIPEESPAMAKPADVKEQPKTAEPSSPTDDSSEIQSIMEQFEDGMGGLGEKEIMSPRLEKAGPLLSSPSVFPPRRSSLEPISSGEHLDAFRSEQSGTSTTADSHPQRSSSLQPISTPAPEPPQAQTTLTSSISSASLHKPPPPLPDPEPDLPFDFHRFLEQLRHRTADPVAKFLRSFLSEFGKKQWMVHEQVKIISDFLEFISKKMAQCEVWRTVSDAEFDNAREGMEKLVMNRLYNQCFAPAIPSPEPVGDAKGRRKGAQVTMGPGRRGQHQEDVERDEVLAQKVRIYGWVKEEHLDIKPVEDKGRKFLRLAQQELSKVNSYRAPRDKVICVLNSCKVIFGFLRSAQSDQSADSFIPLLIYTVLQANPEHLVSNVQYILRFRNQDKLGGEAGYYISSLMGAIQFIEALDRTSLTVSDAEFEKNVEAAVSAIAERHSAEMSRSSNETGQVPDRQLQPSPQIISEKSSLSRPQVTPRNSLDAERAQRPSRSPVRRAGLRSEMNSDGEEDTAVVGLLRSIQKPLSTIGRIFSDDGSGESTQSQITYPNRAPATPQPPPRRISPSPQTGPSQLGAEKPPHSQQRSAQPSPQRMSAEDAAALQASAEAEQARKLQAKEHEVVIETLQGMFPGLDRDVIDDVVRQKEGRVGLAVDACLALSN